MDKIELIRERHSVRNYEAKRIEAEKISKIRDKIDELNKEGNLHLQLIEDAGKTYNKLLNRFAGLGSAPSVIICAGKDDETLEERIGSYGEDLVLYIQGIRLNTCWAGTFNKMGAETEVNDGEKIVISIAVGYGKDKGKPHKSKTPEQVIEAKGDRPYWFNKGVEMALLAPTAINQQKFKIRLNDDESVEIIDKGGPFSKVDKGIVKRHFEIGAKTYGDTYK